ncbi:hypothetical protein H9L10_13390 [Phycicoccus endophyticus]|uniref:DUF2029 domain-containing protein n=1 Tax=Phycicoccus endophyticus TaxID=1690220 RepID=A0A7G9R0S7_9MICO|nr:hypothetical protein [Phycicoccus endophyticus]NHI19492.1 hypothetical protein [Phycicoccus endophyticus]QNN49202.1 hypothetical protein H9L10_13390 [Phycicoccus endophyticus]GGL39583.1 hypothetical protein GCM10012283_22630 [Phycicoccus endophyticus]
MSASSDQRATRHRLLTDRLLGPFGGPRGRYAPAAARGVAGLAPVVLLLGLPLVLAALRQAACASNGWQGRAPVWRQCASPLMTSFVEDHAGLGVGGWLAGRTDVQLPVVPGAMTALLGSLAPGSGLAQQRWVLVLWAVVAAALLAGLVVAVGTALGHPRADPVMLALSPVVALGVLLSVELVPLALAVFAVWAWSRRRVTLAGVLVALALLGSPLALAPLLAMALVPPAGLRSPRRRLLGTARVSLVLVVGPVAAVDLGLLLRPVRAWAQAGAAAGSPWFVPTLAGHPLAPRDVVLLAVLGLLLGAALAVLLARRRPRPCVAQVALVALVPVLLTAPALPPARALWLVPFVALAGVPWRDHLVWAGAEVVHAVALFGWLTSASDPAHGLPAGWYATALALRLLAVGRLAWIAWTLVPTPAPARSSIDQ